MSHLDGHVRAAAPQDPRTALDRARVCWAALDPECAESELAQVRSQLAALAPELQLEALRLSAEVALSGERAAEAHTFLLALLERDPRFSPAGWPGPWLEALAAARKAAPDRLPPELEVQLPAEVRARTAVPIEVRGSDASGIQRCELVLAARRIVLLSADGLVFRGEIPKEDVRVPELLVRLEARDHAGNVATWPPAGEQRVSVVAPPRERETPITSRWWFWTAIGAVVVGGAVGLVIALDGGEAETPTRLGNVRVVMEFP